MRVHLVSEHASPLALIGGVDAGGQNVHVAALALGLAEHGCDVVVHTRRDDPTLPRRVRFAPGVEVDHVDAGPPEPVPRDELLPFMEQFADELADRWQQERPDAVHAHFWMSGLAALDAGRRTGVPVALTFHALGAEKRRQQGAADTSPAARRDIEAQLAAGVDLVIATTAAERATLVGLGARPERVAVVPCGVDLDRFHPVEGVAPHPRRVLCVSRLVPRKGIADTVRAVAGLPGVELLVAGGPPATMLADDPHARELRALVERLGIGDRVRLLGAVDRAELPALYRSAAVVCCTPWYEPFGLVAVEAMACGVPVLASAVGGLAETVDDGCTGVLVPPRSPWQIRRALAALLADPARRDAMGVGAAHRAQRYGWRGVSGRTLALLRSMAAAGGRAQAGAGVVLPDAPAGELVATEAHP